MPREPYLFDMTEFIQPLTEGGRRSLCARILSNARLALRYMYEVKEACGLLHVTYDEMQTLLRFYRLDCIQIRTTIRIPWWSLLEYLLDPADDIDEALADYLKSLPKKTPEETE